MLILDHHGIERRPLGDGYTNDVSKRKPRGSWLIQQQVQGHIDYLDDQHDVELASGSVFISRFGSRAHYGFLKTCRGPATIRWLVIRGDLCDELMSPIAQAGPIFQSDLKAFDHWYENTVHGASREHVHDAITAAGHIYTSLLRLPHALGLDANKSNPDKHSATADAMRLLQANPLHPWSLAELARQCGCTRDHLCRRFKQSHGLTPQQWLNQRRLSAAEDLLRNTRMSVEAIAEQCGFREAQVLARHIRQAHGVGPREFRN